MRAYSTTHIKHESICLNWWNEALNVVFLFSPDRNTMNRKHDLWTQTKADRQTCEFLNFFLPSRGINSHFRLQTHTGKSCFISSLGNSTAGDETAVKSVKPLTGSHFLLSNFQSVKPPAVEWNNPSFRSEPGICCRPSVHYCHVEVRGAVTALVSAAVVITYSKSLSLLMDKGCFHVS